ncbi:hypothetical protein SDC9_131393 [bioreactor metagenome]|uniref:Uncharacterized protein n=1 Tax=bioreactor metagenome TaxID=1076179 RepID=A0A645D6R2_9ZZZZ
MALVAVKKESINGVNSKAREDTGRHSKIVPVVIIIIKASAKKRVTVRLFMKFEITRFIEKLIPQYKSYHIIYHKNKKSNTYCYIYQK